MAAVDWSQLPKDLLMRIVENHLQYVEEYIMFSCVCHSWQRAAHGCDKSKLRYTWSRQTPWLMLTDGNVDSGGNAYSFGMNHYFYDDGFLQNHRHYYSDEDHLIVGDQDEIINGAADNMNDQNEIISDHDNDTGHEDKDKDEEEGNSSTIKASDLFHSSIMNNNFCYQRRALKLRWNNIEKQYRLNLPQADDKACWGSPYGWIVTLGLDRRMELLNPLTKARLPLPSQETCSYSWKGAPGRTIRIVNINRAVLLRLMPTDDTQTTTANAENDHDEPWLVVLFHRVFSVVSISKPGDKSWKEIPFPNEPDPQHMMMDVIYCSEMRSLLFVDSVGNLHSCDVRDTQQPQLLKTYYVEGPLDLRLSAFYTSNYIVRSIGGLLILARTRTRESSHVKDYETSDFRVYKLDSFNYKWDELHDLNGVTLFVGNNVTISISASDSGIRSNCIFFNDDNRCAYDQTTGRLGGHDMGVYDMAERSSRQFLNNEDNTKSSYCCPLWFSPAL